MTEETQPFLNFLRERREAIKEGWGIGAPLDDTAQSIAIVYGDIMDLDYERDVRPHYEEEEKTNAE